MVPQVNLVEGRRGDTYRSYLRPVIDKPNLTVLKNARVLRLDWRHCSFKLLLTSAVFLSSGWMVGVRGCLPMIIRRKISQLFLLVLVFFFSLEHSRFKRFLGVLIPQVTTYLQNK
jgi:hypothetical protein